MFLIEEMRKNNLCLLFHKDIAKIPLIIFENIDKKNYKISGSLLACLARIILTSNLVIL